MTLKPMGCLVCPFLCRILLTEKKRWAGIKTPGLRQSSTGLWTRGVGVISYSHSYLISCLNLFILEKYKHTNTLLLHIFINAGSRGWLAAVGHREEEGEADHSAGLQGRPGL